MIPDPGRQAHCLCMCCPLSNWTAVPDQQGPVYLEDNVVGLHRVGRGEGRGASQQLKHQDAHGPVVGGVVVALVQDDLGRHVLRRAAERPRLLACGQFLGKAEVHLQHGTEIMVYLVSA